VNKPFQAEADWAVTETLTELLMYGALSIVVSLVVLGVILGVKVHLSKVVSRNKDNGSG